MIVDVCAINSSTDTHLQAELNDGLDVWDHDAHLTFDKLIKQLESFAGALLQSAIKHYTDRYHITKHLTHKLQHYCIHQIVCFIS